MKRSEQARGRSRSTPTDLYIEAVTDEGYVFFRLPNGAREMRQIPIEQVPRYRRMAVEDRPE